MPVKVSVTVCLIPEAKGGPFVLWDDLPASVQLAASLGYDAIELFPPAPDALRPGVFPVAGAAPVWHRRGPSRLELTSAPPRDCLARPRWRGEEGQAWRWYLS